MDVVESDGYRSVHRVLALLQAGDRIGAIAAARCTAERAWSRGDSAVANAATALASTLTIPEGAFLGDLRRLVVLVADGHRPGFEDATPDGDRANA
jgi:hypothetical protein